MMSDSSLSCRLIQHLWILKFTVQLINNTVRSRKFLGSWMIYNVWIIIPKNLTCMTKKVVFSQLKKNTVHHHHYQFPNAASNSRSIRKTTPPMWCMRSKVDALEQTPTHHLLRCDCIEIHQYTHTLYMFHPLFIGQTCWTEKKIKRHCLNTQPR